MNSDPPAPDGTKVGCLGLGPDSDRCFRQLSLMEIQESFVSPPKPATVARWRQRIPSDFTLALRAWLLITHGAETPAYGRLPDKFRKTPHECGMFRWTDQVRQAYATTVQCAQQLQATAIVFDTPPGFTPTPTNRQRLEQFFERIERPPGVHLVWQPRGVWTARETNDLCHGLGLCAALDPVLDEQWPTGPTAYLRLAAARYTENHFHEIAVGTGAYANALCVFAGSAGLDDALRLRAALELVAEDRLVRDV